MSESDTQNIQKLDKLITNELITKSNNIDKITDKIYLGDEEGAKELDFFKNENIHNILSIMESPPTYPTELNINHKTIILEEKLKNFIPYLRECIDFIEKSDKIFVHCSCGMNRSPAIVIGYLMWKTHNNFNLVYNYMQKRRPRVELTMGFVSQLKKFDKLLKSNNYNLNTIDSNSKIIK
jgi:hypothetical protein